jgi:hypothetical protein
VLLALSASAQTPAQPGRVTDRKPAESRPPVAQYDIGLISRRLVALEAQVAELTKRNEAQAAEIAKLKIPHGLTTVKGNTLSAGPSVQDRLNRLEQAMGSHTHYLSGIGVIALNALPGMQDIANKAGVGHVIQQWKDLKVHVTFGTGAGPERTGPPVTQNR